MWLWYGWLKEEEKRERKREETGVREMGGDERERGKRGERNMEDEKREKGGERDGRRREKE